MKKWMKGNEKWKINEIQYSNSIKSKLTNCHNQFVILKKEWKTKSTKLINKKWKTGCLRGHWLMEFKFPNLKNIKKFWKVKIEKHIFKPINQHLN